MAKTDIEIERDWRAAMSDPDGPRKHLLAEADLVEQHFYSHSNLTRDEMTTLWHNCGSVDGWGECLWRKLKSDNNDDSIVGLARLLAIGQRMGWIHFNTSTREFYMHQNSDDINGLMWQIALTNWEATKKDLTLSHLNTMVSMGLENLHRALLPQRTSMSNSTGAYSPEEAEKALAKMTLLVTELNERMRQTQRPALPEADKRS